MKKRKKVELQVYQIPEGDDLLAFLGSSGIKEYGLNKYGKRTHINHCHNLLEIAICRGGSGEIILKKQSVAYAKGTIMVIPPNYPHQIISTLGEKSFWEFIYVNPKEFLNYYYMEERGREKLINKLYNQPILKTKKEIPLFERELDCLMDQIRIQEYGYKACVRGLIFTLLMEIVKVSCMEIYEEAPKYKGSRTKLEKLKKAMNFVEEHYAEEIKISDIAKSTYISETYLRKIFAENHNMTPVQYVNYIRVNAACKILQREMVTVSEVSRRVGFENMSTFIRNFKNITGKTPKVYAKEFQ